MKRADSITVFGDEIYCPFCGKLVRDPTTTSRRPCEHVLATANLARPGISVFDESREKELTAKAERFVRRTSHDTPQGWLKADLVGLLRSVGHGIREAFVVVATLDSSDPSSHLYGALFDYFGMFACEMPSRSSRKAAPPPPTRPLTKRQFAAAKSELRSYIRRLVQAGPKVEIVERPYMAGAYARCILQIGGERRRVFYQAKTKRWRKA